MIKDVNTEYEYVFYILYDDYNCKKYKNEIIYNLNEKFRYIMFILLYIIYIQCLITY
jgi:hypothetical protein